jgi:hypothetical protein
METVVSLVAFFALIGSWFVLPAAPPRAKEVTVHAVPETLPTAA